MTRDLPARDPAGRRAVVNAINLTGRGGRTILADCLSALDRSMPVGWTATAYVAPGLALQPLDRIETVEIPRRWNSWIDRLWFELWGMAAREAGHSVTLFLSLQGASARINAERKAVYCHQNLPLSPLRLGRAVKHPFTTAQWIIYDFLYRFAIGRGDWIVVQQQWTREAFRTRYRQGHVIVARPVSADAPDRHFRRPPCGSGRLQILVPLAAYPNKDVETAIETARQLRRMNIDFEMSLTIDPAESGYAAELARRATDVPEVRMLGFLSREALEDAYRSHHLMLFPSRVESWGLPLSEGKAHGIGIVATDHPYAHEAIGDYDGAAFFPAGDAPTAARLIAGYWTEGQPLGHSTAARPPEPFADSWDALVSMLTSPGAPGPDQRHDGKELL